MSDLKDKLEKNQKLILFIILGILAVFFDFNFVIKPVVSGLSKIVPEVGKKSKEVIDIQRNVNNIPVLTQQIADSKEKLSQYKKIFATKKEISPLLQNLSDTAKEYNVKLVSITPMQTADLSEGAYNKFPIFLSAISQYHSFGQFLNKLENSDIFMRVTDLKIQGDETGTGTHKFDIIVVTYMLNTTE